MTFLKPLHAIFFLYAKFATLEIGNEKGLVEPPQPQYRRGVGVSYLRWTHLQAFALDLSQQS
jgi:hypothetical protein